MSNLPEQSKNNRFFLTVMSILSGMYFIAGGAVLVSFIPADVVGLGLLLIGGIQVGIMYYLNGKIVPVNNVVAYQPNKSENSSLYAGGAAVDHTGSELPLDAPVGYLAEKTVTGPEEL